MAPGRDTRSLRIRCQEKTAPLVSHDPREKLMKKIVKFLFFLLLAGGMVACAGSSRPSGDENDRATGRARQLEAGHAPGGSMPSPTP